MDDQRTAVVVVVVGVLILAGGAALALTGGLPPGEDSTLPGASAPTTDTSGTASDGSGGGASTDGGASGDGGGSNGTGPAAEQAPYSFTIDRITECGSTCRDVTATLTNTGNESRSNVRVNTKLMVDNDVLWEGDQNVGSMEPGESFTETRTVDVGYWGGLKIQQNDGYVTIRTTVVSEQGTVTFEDRKKVA